MEYPEFSHRTRLSKLKELEGSEAPAFDALIIGGGIVGAGLARELGIRGLRTLLVEKGDFASGTSSRSSKLIHGGLRYLEMFDFGLVFEALAERHWLLKTHPHLVQPLEFNVPIYKKAEAPPGARGTALVGLALWLYDGLSLFRTPFFHGRHGGEETKELFPRIRPNGLRGSYYYADAMMLDDEVVLESVLDAVRRGVTALNYVRATRVSERGADGLFPVTLQDSLAPGPAFSVKAREVIVCAGPWTEAIGGVVAKGSGKKLRPSRGVHLILPWNRLPVRSCLVMYAPDGRILFVIPRTDLGPGAEVTIVGTTDAPEHGDLDTVHATREDLDYLLRVLAEYFPEARIAASDVAMTYAGVRPLIDDGAATEAKTSREHEIWRNEAGIVFMAGGKYTTFRRISQEIADFAFPGTKHREAESKVPLSTPEDYKTRLVGSRVWGRFTDEWVRWKLRHHAPCTLEDVVFRRLPVWMGGEKAVAQVLGRVAELCQGHFGWSRAEIAAQEAAVERKLDLGLACLR